MKNVKSARFARVPHVLVQFAAQIERYVVSKALGFSPWFHWNRPVSLLAKHLSGFRCEHLEQILDGRLVTEPMARPELKSTRKRNDGQIATKNERHAMHLLFTPVLGSAIWIGGGSVGLILVVVVVVLLLRG